MKSLDIFLQQNSLKNKTRTEQKKFLRKFLTERRIEQYNLFGDTKYWGEKQFYTALAQLNISSLTELQNKFQIACFFPIRGELNFIPFAKNDWLMPKVKNDSLEWFEYGDGKTNYTLNSWNIPEKEDAYCFQYTPGKKPLLCFTPGIAGDSQGYRLGYGRGYYDKFLAKNSDVISVLCLPSEEFFFDSLPHEEHDMKTNFTIY